MAVRQQVSYEQLVNVFRALVHEAIPPSATVAVVSKGDQALLLLGNRDAWHFPQRTDGVYAGYYPSDSSNAISHLEAVRAKGAEYLAFPAASLWWLDEYEDFGRHLETRYREVARNDKAGVIFALSDETPRDGDEDDATGALPASAKGSNGGDPSNGDWPDAESAEAEPEAYEIPVPDTRGTGLRTRLKAPKPLSAYVDDENVEDLRKVFDPQFYSDQLEGLFSSEDAALAHYLEFGSGGAADPHPLFDTRWYLKQNPSVRLSAQNPLVHFLKHGWADELDPSPYFDTQFYYSKRYALKEEGGNALVHYVENASAKNAARPNPLFHDSYYLDTYRDVHSEAATPFEHFLRGGCDNGRFGSPLHRNILMQAQRPSNSLVRDNWRRGTVLFFTSGERHAGRPFITDLAEELGRKYHVGSLVVAYSGLAERSEGADTLIVLEDYELATEIFRPAALRFLARCFAALRPRFVVSDVTVVLEPFARSGIGTFYMMPEADELPPRASLEAASNDAQRVLFPSSSAFHAASERMGRRPTNVALKPFPGSQSTNGSGAADATTTADYAARLAELASTDLGIDLVENRAARRSASTTKPKIIVPASDWAVSGVNASLQAVGQALIGLGWDLEIVFTRAEEMVLQSAHGHLPELPYRFLEREKTGVPGMWEAMIAEVESQAPCILFMAYDFLANSIAPALSDRVGVVTWAQADDGDYYEQVYRLGLYCNAVVCVSEQIKENVRKLNPAIAERAQVIHNSSVWRSDVAKRRAARSSVMRLIYSGRLVEYQKRISDFIELARALDRTGVPYEISLVGTFSKDKEKEAFQRDAAAHIADGRITIPGRMDRAGILDALTSHDFFVLLSDFEGLPLSLVEAMARGCVPVVPEIPSGIPELIESGEDGLIVGGRDYDEWAKQLVEIWRDGRRHALMSRRARSKVRNGFSMDTVGRQFDEMFTRVAEEIADGSYRRPPSLHWGPERTEAGDVLPPPNMHRPAAFQWAGLH
jgi:glycosyltransferase involved in cell wall biosynthesis